MDKRDFTAFMLVGICALAIGGQARAEQSLRDAAGCAVLADIIYSEVTAAIWRGPHSLGSVTDERASHGIAVCAQTSRTVREAFSAAMISVGADFRWDDAPPHPGDFCLSGFLEQCYPDRYPLQSPVGTWGAVSGTVQRAMPLGVASDQSIFSQDALRLALRAELGRLGD
jgi:hypothetical protein